MIGFSGSRLVLAALASAAVGKIGAVSLDGQGVDRPSMSSLTFVGAASAASGAQKKEVDEVSEAPGEGEDSCAVPEEIFAEIQHERQLLAQQGQAMLEREAKLQLGQQTLETEAQQLLGFKSALEELLAKVESAQNEDIDRLVNLYRNMKPKEAAGIINELDMESTVLILATMAERDAAPILANIDPSRARAISKILIQRSKLPGDQDFSGIKLR